jgi:hypothetical protein
MKLTYGNYFKRHVQSEMLSRRKKKIKRHMTMLESKVNPITVCSVKTKPGKLTN